MNALISFLLISGYLFLGQPARQLFQEYHTYANPKVQIYSDKHQTTPHCDTANKCEIKLNAEKQKSKKNNETTIPDQNKKPNSSRSEIKSSFLSILNSLRANVL